MLACNQVAWHPLVVPRRCLLQRRPLLAGNSPRECLPHCTPACLRASLQLQCACFLKRAASPSAPGPAAALFNRIVGQQVAIVFDYPGVTRDRWAVGLRRAYWARVL